MDITMIKNLIYNLLYLAANYDLILTIAPNETVKNQLHNYSSDCKNNATFLDKLYQELNTTSFFPDRKSTRLNSSHVSISYAVFCLKKKRKKSIVYYSCQ